jgi:hypothetical protein
MARYVLLRFDDDDQADHFVEAIKQNDVFFSHKNPDGTGNYGYITGVQPVGVFQSPTKFCDCENKLAPSVRSKKYGWWVHPHCRKPKAGISQQPKNLLYPDGYRVHKQEVFLNMIEPWRAP